MPDSKMKYLVKKELKSLFRSRWLIFGLIISPVFAWLFEGAFLSFVVAQTTSEPSRVFITLEDEGVWGQTLYDAIESDMDELLISELLNITKQEGDEMVANRTLSVWVRIPSNFTQELQYNNASTLVIWVNTGNFRATAAGNRVAGFARSVIEAGVLYLLKPPMGTHLQFFLS
jgi:ABC-type Na+ efflux pump permease subunit